jgi:hypothetical protein
MAGGLTAVLAYIFIRNGKTPSEVLAMPEGERAVCVAGARLMMQADRKAMSIFQ